MRHVIVGNGVAGVTAARLIARQQASKAEIDIYTDESFHYYQRPKLPDFISGSISLEELIPYGGNWYEERGIHVHLEMPVTRLLPAEKAITLKGGKRAPYDRLILANGSHSFVPPIAGAEMAGVFTLRTLSDAIAIRQKAPHSRHAVVIGGGLLGLETARGLRALCEKVTVIEIFPRLLPRQLDEAGAGILQKTIEGFGIEVLLGVNVELIEGDRSLSGVVLKGGNRLPADMVVISAGVRSNVALAKEAGLTVNRGVVVDTALRTSHPEIFAIGDVAEFDGRVWGIIPAAIEQARIAAVNVVATDPQMPAHYSDIVPSNTLKIMGVDLTSIGTVNPEGDGFQEMRRQEPEAGVYEKLVIREGKIVGAIVLGKKERVGLLTRLINEGMDVSSHVDRLLDADFDLTTLT